MEYANSNQSLLGILYDEKHPEHNDMFLCKPDEVRLISSFDTASHGYLLNEERLNMFMRAMEVSTLCSSDDFDSLYKRSIGIKILYENITIYGKKIVEMIDKSLKTKFIYCMLHVCSNTKLKKIVPRYEWLNQSIFCTKTVATDEDKFFNFKYYQSYISFKNYEFTFLSKRSLKVKTYKSLHSKNCEEIAKKGIEYVIVPSYKVHDRPYSKNKVSVIDPLELTSGNDISKVFDHIDVIITTELTSDLVEERLSQMNDLEKEQSRTIVVISYENFLEMQEIISQEDTQSNEYQKIFQGIKDTIELDEDIKMEKDDELIRKNTLNIQYDYDEVGYQN